MSKIIFSFFVYFSAISYAYAYIDPGTGSIILQALLGFIAAFLAGISFYWNRFKSFIKKIFKKDKNEKP